MKFFLFLIGFLLTIGIAGQASAITMQNASFESDLNTGWDSSGIASTGSSVDDANGTTYAPTDLNSFAQLDGSDAYITQALSWSTGDTISFDWNFLSFDGADTDYGFFGILDLSSTVITEITQISADEVDSTGWEPFSYEFEFDSTSNFAIIFGVVSPIDSTSFNDPILLVDNITATTVPEPATLFLLGFGLLSIAGIRRKL